MVSSRRASSLAFLAGLLICGPASALTVDDVIKISGGLAQMNCASKILHDGLKETAFCEPYKLSPGLAWMIAGNMRKVAAVVEQYMRLHNQELAALPHKADGALTDEAAVAFQVRDRAWLDEDVKIELDHLKRSDIEPLNLGPGVLAALYPIIDQ